MTRTSARRRPKALDLHPRTIWPQFRIVGRRLAVTFCNRPYCDVDLARIDRGRGLVVRLGGNALFTRGSLQPRTDVVAAVVALLESTCACARTVVVVPGGMGGQIYLEWGRKLGVSEAVLSDVGRRTIDITAEILAEVLWSRTSGWADAGRPRAAPARSRAELLEYTATSRVVVMGCALEGAITSDSLAVLAAELLGFDVLSVKATGLAALGNASHVDPAHLLAEALVANDVERAGWHPSIDIWALRLLKRSDVRLSVIGVDDFVARRLESVVSVGG